MSDQECMFRFSVSLREVSEALDVSQCEHCGATTTELIGRGEFLEVCGEEFASDLVIGERTLAMIALCPRCHRDFHRDFRGQHKSCQIEARISCESTP